jgi:phosphate-selective porin
MVASMTAAVCITATSAGFGQNKELVDALVQNGHLTSEQASQILQSGRPAITPAGANFRDFRIRGRIQTQFGYARTDDDDGSDAYSTLEARRVRLGAQGTLLQNVRAQLEMNLVPGSNVSMRSAFLQWREHEAAYVKVGYDRPAFGLERNTSSASIFTVERSHLTNTIISNDMLGVSVEGKVSPFSYGLGVYTNRDNMNPPNNARYLYNASAGVSLDHLMPEGHKLRLRADLMLNDDSGGNFGFEEGFAVGATYGFGAFDFSAEYMHANAFNGDTTNGWYVMPSYFVTDKFQLVGRFEWMESDAANGIRSPSRYARRAADRSGDSFQALYAGANYYIKGDANKLMFGVELAELMNTPVGDQEAITVYSAWRVLF